MVKDWENVAGKNLEGDLLELAGLSVQAWGLERSWAKLRLSAT